jgi:probable rRNA maturation factor
VAFVVSVSLPPDTRVSAALLESAVEAALLSMGAVEGEISLALMSDDEIRTLNRSWLDHDWVPDVLSFDLGEEGGPLMGDIYVGLEQAQRQAGQCGVSLEEELVRLSVHGTLHVLGEDHPEDAGERMSSPFFRRQERLVAEVMEKHRQGRRGPDPSRRSEGVR